MKVLIISDIHLRAYHRYNKFPDQRLLSFIELAKDVVEIGKEKGINVLIITGDIIDKSTLTPKEIHVLFNMFTILASHFTIYSIVGNHDMKLKKGEFEREDSIVTLLEEIDGIKFLHQEVLNLSGRTLAFENWVPEFNLDWIKDPVDLYFSHATIDYDQTGFYGMDTSVFEGKFTLGFFGDIHVRREIENYISVGNTKQESLSDRFQGGGVVLDLDTLEWERFDIDPEHKKYLYLLPTKEAEEEGWVDLEGEDMTYRIFRPEKVAGKTIEFKLPKTTDINQTLNEIMKELNLLDLHKKIKDQTNYQPIDFNFKLNKLIVTNFRSIKNYTLDFKEDYVITGHNGSGKSTLITALFYALVGRKTLKQDITFGEKSCTLELNVTYQNQNFNILRGTDGGDYGLTIDGKPQKYNNKLEFEKDVILHLPFIPYHESFFFNYWDTELLSSVKLDRRFDIIAKYFRLDALSDYNDVGTLEYKKVKKELKDLKERFSNESILATSKGADYDKLKSELKGKPKESELKDLQLKYKRKKVILSDLEIKRNILSVNETSLKTLETELNNTKYSYESDLKELEGCISESDLDVLLSTYESRSALKARRDKGNTLLSEVSNDISRVKDSISNGNYTLSLIDPGIKKDLDPKLIEELESLTKFLDDTQENLTKEKTTLDLVIKQLKSDKLSLETLLSEAEKPSECVTCKRPISNEDNVKLLTKNLESVNSSLDINSSKLTDLKSKIEAFLEVTKVAKEKRKSEIRELIEEVRLHNLEVDKSSESVNSLRDAISRDELTLEGLKTKEVNYSKLLKDIETELNSSIDIPDSDNTKNHITKTKYLKLSKSKTIYDDLKLRYDDLKLKFDKELGAFRIEISELETELETYSSIDEDSNLEAALLIAKYQTYNDLYKEVKILRKELKLLEDSISDSEKLFSDLETYCQLTSRSGEVLKKTLDELTKTFSNSSFRFTTNKSQASGKLVTDMSVEYLVGKQWVSYPALSSGQKTLCDLYFISKVITGVGVIALDETLRFLDDENLKIAAELISDIKKQNFLLSTHSPNLSMEGISVLSCRLNSKSETEIITF